MRASACRLAGAGLAGVLALSFHGLAFAADGPSCRTSDPMRNSMFAKADQGADALRRYAFITRAIHQMDANEVGSSIDAWRAQAGCAKRTASSDRPEAPVAVAAPAAEGRS